MNQRDSLLSVSAQGRLGWAASPIVEDVEFAIALSAHGGLELDTHLTVCARAESAAAGLRRNDEIRRIRSANGYATDRYRGVADVGHS